MTHLFLKKDVWGQPYVERCQTCAALLLNKEDAELHRQWHAKPCLCCEHPSITTGDPYVQKIGNWEGV